MKNEEINFSYLYYNTWLKKKDQVYDCKLSK